MCNYLDNIAINEYKLVNYTKASNDLLLLVLDMRNHSSVRQMMINNHIISQDSHINFVNNLKACKNRGFWVVKKNNKILGSLNIEDNGNDSFSGGMFVNPEYLNNGYGIVINYLLLEVVFDIFKGKQFSSLIKKDNKAVIRLHLFFNGKITKYNNEFDEVSYSHNNWINSQKVIEKRMHIFTQIT